MRKNVIFILFLAFLLVHNLSFANDKTITNLNKDELKEIKSFVNYKIGRYKIEEKGKKIDNTFTCEITVTYNYYDSDGWSVGSISLTTVGGTCAEALANNGKLLWLILNVGTY